MRRLIPRFSPKALILTVPLITILALVGCGGGDGGGLTTPPPDDDPPPSQTPDGPPDGPAPVGDVIYALDNGNRLLMFGTESANAISRLVSITGLPILKRMIGIDFRPSNGKLYGVGNDSRVYVIDTLTGAATPVGEPFTPEIASFFDIHFGMDFEPSTGRIRLVSNELGVNWSINPDDGTATTGKSPHYAAGDPHEGERAHIAGLTFVPASALPATATARHGDARIEASTTSGPCEELLMAMDNELGQMITSCDPDSGEFTSLGPIPEIESLACAELDYSGPGGGIWAAGQRINGFFNSIGTVDPESGAIDWKITVPDNFLIQSITFKPKDDGLGLRVAPTPSPRFSVGRASAPALDQAGVDPVALCRGGQ
jgi:Domain of unknown function (DUF4394)